PEIDLATTSSLQDPSISQLRGYGGSPLDLLTQQDERERRFRQEQESTAAHSAALRGSVASGATGYYGARLFSALGRSLGLGELSVRPVLVYGETDPSA